MVSKTKKIGRRPPSGLFARLVESLSDVFTLVLDQQRRIVYANAAFLEHFGLEWEAVSGQLCFSLGRPFTTTAGKQMSFCPREVSPYFPARHLLTRELDGKCYVYQAIFYHLGEGEEGAWTVCTFRDITQMFNLESQVRQLDELERILMQASIDGIVVNDMLGNILIFNEGASRILGYRPEEVVGQMKVQDLYAEGVARQIKQLLYYPSHGGVGILENYETQVRGRDGSLVPIWLSARLLRANGQEVGIVGYFRDLRERKRLEEKLLRHERLAALGKMVAHISHEIKNPLERQPELSTENRHKVQIIHQEVERLEKFLADLANFTRTATVRKLPSDILALIAEVANFMEGNLQDKGVQFVLQVQTPIPAVPLDSGQIRQVLLNLFKNALEAMPRGGQLTISVAVQDNHLVLLVQDTGQGIPPEHLKSLFTPFFSTKERGTGLGLTICRSLIDQHQGEIQFASEVDRGTTCIIRLPLLSP